MNALFQIGGLVAVLGGAGYGVLQIMGFLGRQAAQRRIFEAQNAILNERLKTFRDLRNKKRESGASWNGWRKFKVVDKVEEGGNICSVYLKPHDGAPLPLFKGGQYLTLQFSGVPNPENPAKLEDMVRCYSLSNSPGKDYFRISVKKVPAPRDNPGLPPGRVSSFVHDRLNVGDMVNVRAPGGEFVFDETNQGAAVLIGGGVGITPVLSMLNQIYETQSKRQIYFYYCITNGKEAAFRERLEEISSEMDNVQLCIICSRPDPNEKLGEAYHREGRLSVDVFKEMLPSNNFDFYTCGPPPLMLALREGLSEWGVPKARIHDEAFVAAPAATKKEVQAQVEFKKSGKKLKINGEIASLLDFAEANGVEIPFGCRAGSCLTCVTAIRSGEVEYPNNSPSGDLEEGCCLPCICVPKGDLVIEA